VTIIHVREQNSEWANISVWKTRFSDFFAKMLKNIKKALIYAENLEKFRFFGNSTPSPPSQLVFGPLKGWTPPPTSMYEGDCESTFNISAWKNRFIIYAENLEKSRFFGNSTLSTFFLTAEGVDPPPSPMYEGDCESTSNISAWKNRFFIKNHVFGKNFAKMLKNIKKALIYAKNLVNARFFGNSTPSPPSQLVFGPLKGWTPTPMYEGYCDYLIILVGLIF